MGILSSEEPMDDVGDEALLKAIRRRLLDEIRSGKSGGDAERIVNNVYGGGGGLTERLYGGAMEPEDDGGDYMVDIDRTDVIDPETGKVTGWKKRVHRYRQALEEKKKLG